MVGEPLQSVDKRLIIVDTEAQDFGSGAGAVEAVDGGGVFVLLDVVAAEAPGPAAFDNLREGETGLLIENQVQKNHLWPLKTYLYNNSETKP